MSYKIQVMIVEDERVVALDLKLALQQDGYQVVGIVDNFTDALLLFQQQHVDVLLMDIHIYGEKDGIECAAEIMKLREVPLIYLTAFSDAATIQRVKHTRPAAFLTKPYDIANVRIAIELALHNFATAIMNKPTGSIEYTKTIADNKPTETATFLKMDEFIFIKHMSRFVKAKLDDIIYAESDNNYVHLITKSQKFMLRLTLKNFIEDLQFPAMLRVHRSYAVNINHILSFDDVSIKTEKLEIPIGANYKETFFKHFKLR